MRTRKPPHPQALGFAAEAWAEGQQTFACLTSLAEAPAVALVPDSEPPPTAATGRGSRLRVCLHRGTVLLTLDVVRAVLGLDARGVLEEVESGRLRWVWDISAHQGRRCARTGHRVRELRFWVGELMAPHFCHALQPSQAIALMLGSHRQLWRTREVMQHLLCSQSIVTRLVDQGELTGPLRGRTRWVTRRSLERFLFRRLLE